MQDVASLPQISYCSQTTIPHNTLESWCNCHKYIITDNITEKAFTGISWRMTWDSAARKWSPRNLQLNKLLASCNDIMSSLYLYWHDEIWKEKFSPLHVLHIRHLQIVHLMILSHSSSHSTHYHFFLCCSAMVSRLCSCKQLVLAFSTVFSCYLFFFSSLVLLLFFSCCCFWFGDHGALWWRAGIVAKNGSGKACSLWCSWCVVFMLLLLLSWS